ncbi:hypothetical protein V6O07_14115, partial [Arthrospira platensis SPKY2]
MSGSKMVSCEHKSALIEAHRYINVEYYDWYEYEYEFFKKDMAEVGVEVRKIYFSGFGSQGDGACFEGTFTTALKYLD